MFLCSQVCSSLKQYPSLRHCGSGHEVCNLIKILYLTSYPPDTQSEAILKQFQFLSEVYSLSVYRHSGDKRLHAAVWSFMLLEVTLLLRTHSRRFPECDCATSLYALGVVVVL